MTIIAIVTAAWMGTRLLRSPIAEALARRIGGSPLADTDQAHELADLRARVTELEERQDFTERALLQDRERGELGQGGRG